ncbi:MAG: RsmE family RNA methyltransferase [Bacilli bacterium]|nr:RsmE family RNA methyltransferase [Bacilli bacterium]
MQRYFATNKSLNLEASDLHHITNVMRMKKGDKIEIINDEKAYLCQIDDIDNFKISIIEEIVRDIDKRCSITLGQALIKENNFDLILQKATELGVNNIIPLKMERSIVKIDIKKEHSKVDRWSKICKEAAEQTHRNNIPDISKPMKLNEIDFNQYDLKLLCSLSEEAKKIKEVLPKYKNCDKMLIVVGPEGGITKTEEEKLVKDGFIKVSLGTNVLRSETVPIYLLSILNYEFTR